MSAPMTDPELQALAEAATPGPWEAHDHTLHLGQWWLTSDAPYRGVDMGSANATDAAFIAAANPTTVLALLARLARADAIEQAAREICDALILGRPNVEMLDALRAALEAS